LDFQNAFDRISHQ